MTHCHNERRPATTTVTDLQTIKIMEIYAFGKGWKGLLLSFKCQELTQEIYVLGLQQFIVYVQFFTFH